MKRLYLTVFLVSCAVLILEISLTRLFSIYLSYHFAFMVISIAMLGIGSAGTVLSVYTVGRRALHGPSEGVNSRLSAYAILAGVSIILGYVVSNQIPFDPVKLSWDTMQIFYVALYCLVLSIPFFFAGILIATAFLIRSEKSALIYGADLLGAGTGSLAVVGLLHIAGPEYAVLTASLLCFAASFAAGQSGFWPGRGKLGFVSIILASINVLMFIAHPEFTHVRLSPYKNLSLSLRYPGAEHIKTYYDSFSRIDTLRSPAVRFAPGLSLTYLDPLPEQIGLSTDGGEMNAVTRSDNKEALKFLEFLPSALAYEIFRSSHPPFKIPPSPWSPSAPPEAGKPPLEKGGMGGFRGINVLVLEPKGGLQALMAEYYNFKVIHKIESNPLMVRIIRDDLNDFSGKIFEHDTWSGLGRSWLRRSQVTGYRSQGYDIIDLPMTGISVSGAFGISEDYRFTVEAFTQYLTALKKDGLMSISLYLIPPPRIDLRILGTVIAAFERLGVQEASKHMAAIRSWDSITILAKKTPFNQEEIREIREFAGDRRFDLVHYPGIQEKETNLYIKMRSNEYFMAFKNILNPETRHLYIQSYLFDIEPVYDENPFFHYYLHLKHIKAIYEVMGQKWQYFIEEGYLLPIIFVQVFILSIILILVPVFSMTIRKMSIETSSKIRFKQFKLLEPFKQSIVFPTLLYFAMLGIGFMFVEVTLIQKCILSLENPAYAFAVVLTAILISSGAGSLLSSKFLQLRVTGLLLLLGGLILAYSLALPLFLKWISPYSLELKIPLVFLALIPPGLCMGIPFPTGIYLLGQRNQALIPWAWAINGCLSVLAPILTIMLAMVSGFKTVLWLGAAAYFMAYVSLRGLMRD